MATTRATPPLLKHLNERTVLETIRSAAPISRAQISRRAGISKPTVSLALESLLRAGLVRQAAHDRDGPSYGALFFEPVAEAAHALGLDLGARFLPVALENDINLAALGEQWHGIARGVDDFVFLSIGTGLGCGIVLRGELHRGHKGAAGELDFIRVGLHEDLDPCADAVSELAAELAVRRRLQTSLRPPYDVRALFAAARRGDELASAL